MKRILLLGIVLAICVLAIPQGVLAGEAGDTVDVVADYAGSEISCIPDTIDAFSWELFEGDADYNLYTDSLQVDVDSTLDWDVNVKDAKISDTGKMVLGSHVLAAPFQIQGTSTGLLDLTGTDQLIQSGAPEDIHFHKSIAQPVGQSDYSGSGYQVTLTFTCSNQWGLT